MTKILLDKKHAAQLEASKATPTSRRLSTFKTPMGGMGNLWTVFWDNTVIWEGKAEGSRHARSAAIEAAEDYAKEAV